MRERKFLLLTLSLIILVGAPAVYSMIQEPAGIRHENVFPGRAPASVSNSKHAVKPASRNAIKAKAVTLDFDCKKKSKKDLEPETDGNLLRLKSDFCLNDKWKNVSIVNETNGFTATVIFIKQGFTTDFIELNEGENKVAISGVDEKGQAIQHLFKINRRAPASL